MTFAGCLFLKLVPFLFVRPSGIAAGAQQPFGAEFPQLESLATGEWWAKGTLAAAQDEKQKQKAKGKSGQGGRESCEGVLRPSV